MASTRSVLNELTGEFSTAALWPTERKGQIIKMNKCLLSTNILYEYSNATVRITIHIALVFSPTNEFLFFLLAHQNPVRLLDYYYYLL